jgi:DNA-binding NtrC family response regulator
MPGRSIRNPRVLLVGTDRAGLDLRGRILYQQGYEVKHCSNGFEAIRAAVAEPVHVVLIDLDRNGVEMTLIVQEIKRLRPSVPTVVLTEEAPAHGTHELCRLADVIVPKEKGAEALVQGVKMALEQNPESPSA